MMRLNKYLAEQGACSRREADRLIEAGLVQIDGRTAGLGESVEEYQQVSVRGKLLADAPDKLVIALNKPRGIVCTSEIRKGDLNIHQFLKKAGYRGTRVFPVGRLDKDSSGLLLMTNDGDLANLITKAVNRHEKEYDVRVKREITPQFLEQMRSGVRIRKVEKDRVILDEITLPCHVEQTGKYRFRIILTQGLNRQIRRMCESLGNQVTELKRTRIMNVELGKLKPGEYRILNHEEYEDLWNECRS